MATLKLPKRIHVDDIRKAMGEKRAEDLLTVIFGPKLMGPPAIKVEKETFSRTIAVIEGTVTGMAAATTLPAVVRLYFRESPHARARFRLWMQAKLAAIENGTEVPGLLVKEPNPGAHNPRPRKKHPKHIKGGR